MLVRITIRLPEPLKEAVEKRAMEENTTFQAIVTRALHDQLQKDTMKKTKKFIIPTVDLGVPLDITILQVIDLLRKYHLSSDQIFDAYLAATALSWRIDTIATDNTKAFLRIKEITVVNPFSV